MKRQILALVILIPLLIGCGENLKKVEKILRTSRALANQKNQVYHRLTGTLGDEEVVMYLIHGDSLLRGTCYFTNNPAPVSLSGTVDSDGKFNIQALDLGYDRVGSLMGTLHGDTTLSGTWTPEKSPTPTPFYLTVSNDSTVSVGFDARFSRHCSGTKKNTSRQSNQQGTKVTKCRTINLDLIKIEVPSADISKKIQREIEKRVCSMDSYDKPYTSIKELMNSVQHDDDDDDYQLEIRCDLVSMDENILALSIGLSRFGSGMAHPTGEGRAYNIDVQTGNVIALDDLLLPGSLGEFNRIAEDRFYALNGTAGWSFKPGEFKVGNDFVLSPGGILFSFDHYELGPYAMGTPRVFVPYSHVKHLLKSNVLPKRWGIK